MGSSSNRYLTTVLTANKHNSSAPQHVFESTNYWTPLTEYPRRPSVHFSLPPQHRDTDSKAWRCRQSHKTRPCTYSQRTTKGSPMSTTALKRGIMNGSIPSAVSDTGATSTAGAPQDPFEETTTLSSKVFILPTGGTVTAIRRSRPTHTYMGTMTTTLTHLFPSEWRHSFTTNHTDENHLHNTAQRDLC